MLSNIRVFNGSFYRIDPLKRVSKKEILFLMYKPRYYKNLPKKLRTKKLGLSIINYFGKKVFGSKYKYKGGK